MEDKFKVVSIHFTTVCNYNCPFCYKAKTNKMMDKDLFLGLPAYLKEITDQVALGGGEPLLFPRLVNAFAKRCKDNNLICNLTTNGSTIEKIPKRWLKHLTMISISFDKSKIKTNKDVVRYVEATKKVREAGVGVGCNLLIDEWMFKDLRFIRLVDFLMKHVDRVFALYPKSAYTVDILPFKHYYQFLSMRYKHFYVDDLTLEILQQGYTDWKKPCHYGKDIISIDEEGFVTGCSFDSQKQAVIKIEKPIDIMKIKKIKFKERFACPYLARHGLHEDEHRIRIGSGG